MTLRRSLMAHIRWLEATQRLYQALPSALSSFLPSQANTPLLILDVVLGALPTSLLRLLIATVLELVSVSILNFIKFNVVFVYVQY